MTEHVSNADELERLRVELAAMQKQRDEAVQDAGRYRWLKCDRCYWVKIQSQPSGDVVFEGRHGMDEAIDYVMRKGGGAC
jgi:hypothetical protein